MEITKIDDNTIEAIEIETTTTKKQYSYDYLLKQKADIQAQKDRDNAQRDTELAKVNALIMECVKLGVKEKVVEEPIVEELIN